MIAKRSTLLMFALAFGVSFMFTASCGTNPTCSAKTCPTGCCSAAGMCQQASASACGTNGAACVACGVGLSCNFGTCTSTVGTQGGGANNGGGNSNNGGGASNNGGGTNNGGGANNNGGGANNNGGGANNNGGGANNNGGGANNNGGGANNGGGSTGPGVVTIPLVGANLSLAGEFNPDAGSGLATFTAYSLSPRTQFDAGNAFDFVVTDLWFDPAAAFPIPAMNPIIDGTTWQQCSDCLYYWEGCDERGGNCHVQYLAQGGTVTYSVGIPNQTAGYFAGSGSNLRFEGWDFNNDNSFDAGKSIIVTSYEFDAGWP